MKYSIHHIVAISIIALASIFNNAIAGDTVVTLNNLVPPAPDNYWNGSDLSGGFSDHCTFFLNKYDTAYGSWNGFAYSRVNDTNTAGWGNQYAVFSGTDVDSNGTYAIAYDSTWDEQDIITLPYPAYVKGFYVNNTTYAALDMLNGSSFSKKFGGTSGDDPDWFKLTITGKDDDGNIIGSVDFYLADYRFTNNAMDYIIKDWTWVDLSSLGPNVATLHFALSSSDNGAWGMNTPAYFALDNLTFTTMPAAITADLNNLIPPTPDNYWNGSDMTGGFTDHGFFFLNKYSTEYGSWNGFAYSRVNDTNTPGYGNQFAVFSGTDVDSNGTYAIAYDSTWDEQDIITLPYPAYVKGFYVNNTTYAALDMLNGSSFSKKFGGTSGNDPDWFKLTITGKDNNGNTIGSVDFYLADYRFTNNAMDYIIKDWTWVDLSALGPNVATLHFALSSSDNGAWGMNTPSYFALDNISIAPSFSGPENDYNNPFDAGVPGFVGELEDGNTNNGNYINPAFATWASTVVDYSPASPAELSPQWTNANNSLGPVTGNFTNIVSLGELSQAQINSNNAPGSITLGFNATISDKEGPDFAIFENGFGDGTNGSTIFAELAYVEVSSDGTNFARFPSISMTTNTIEPYGGFLNARNIFNLAGKHANAYGKSWGTPFDLNNLKCQPLVQSNIVDLSNINYIRIIDIPGSGDFTDSEGNPIYDPWETSGSGGFDLEAVGILSSPQYARIMTDSGEHGKITPFGMPYGVVSVPLGSNYTFTITPDTNYYIADVSVNGISIGRTNSYTFMNITNDQYISATFGHKLSVFTEHGTTTHDGINYLTGDIAVSVNQSTITEGSTQYICTGWIATGSLTNGTGSTTGTFTITNDTVITWLWQTNYMISAYADGIGGTVTPENTWITSGATGTVTATPAPYYTFAGWSGDVQGDTNLPSMSLTVTAPVNITANFYAELATNNTPVEWLNHYNLTNNTPDQEALDDIDHDGLAAYEEYLAGTDPTDANSAFRIIDFGEVNGSNYVTWLGGTNGSIAPFTVYTCSNLMCTSWSPASGEIDHSPSGTNTWWQSNTNNSHYFRIKIK